MKIAVYTIAKNEEQFVQRWAESCAEADYRLILDTGSTDDTLAYAIIHDVTPAYKVFDPWRFDHARNHALALLPEDIDLCIALDMDEVLLPGWRQALEALPAGVTRPRYKYVWSWNPDGTEGLVYAGDKIHARHGYTWKHPVHEVITPLHNETQFFIDGLQIHHHPDQTKSRAQYLPLLEIAVKEEPMDDRNHFYLAREYYFQNRWDEAIPHFNEHLNLSCWRPERAASHRYLAKINPDATEYHLYRAVAEDAGRRESWFALMQLYHDRHEWQRLAYSADMGLLITEKPLDYLCEADAWGWQFHDLAALGYFHTGRTDEAFEQGSLAVALNPGDERLQANLAHYRL